MKSTMGKIIFNFLFFFILPAEVFSQASIQGKIVDSLQAPVPFSIVALLNANDSSIVKGESTDAKGIYMFNDLKSGKYLLKITATGFSDQYSSAIKLDSLTNFSVPEIMLHPSPILQEATVTGVKQTFEFKNGNITVNVENSVLAKGNSVYDLLSKLPGVTLDNNIITMQGKSGVIVMIDGRVQQISNQQLINMLKAMSAESIQKIELLKNPPVKYDAAGTAGMINIVTKKNEQRGFSGTVYTESSQGFYNQTSYGLSLNYKNEKVSIFTSVDGVYDMYHTSERFDRNFTTPSGHTEVDNLSIFNDLETGNDFKFGADWYANKRNTIGFKINGGPGGYNSHGTATNQFHDYNNTGFDHAISSAETPNKWNTVNYNLNAEHQFDTTGTVLDFSTDFTDLNEADKGYNANYFYDAIGNEVLQPNIYRNTNKAETRIFSSKLDFSKTIDSTSTMETGIKGSNINATNNYLFERQDLTTNNFYMDSSLSNNYVYREQTLAAYFNYSKSIRHFNFQLGMRAENTTVNGKNTSSGVVLKKNYSNLFPNISMEFVKNKNHNFQLNLNRRIDRPAYDQLNPFVIYRDQYSYFEGNPFLQPEYCYTAELTYSFKGIINNSISYSKTNDFMLDYTIQNDSTKIFIESNKNIKFNTVYAYTLFIKYDMKPWWELSLNGDFAYREFKGDVGGVPFRTYGINYSANLSNTFLLPNKTKLEIIGIYRGPNVYGIIKIDQLWQTAFAIKKSFFKDKMDCSIGMSDVLNTWKFHTHSQFDNQNWNFYHKEDTRRVIVSISYNFGRVKTDERDVNSNAEEKGRLKH